MNEDALRWLHAIDDLHLPVIDQKLSLAALEAAQEANGEAWTIAMLDRERWVTHAFGRLQASAEYQDRLTSRPLTELLGELADEAAALGAWGAIAQYALDARADLEPEVRGLLAQTLRDIACAGAQAWARARMAYELLAQQGDTRP